MSSSAQTKGQVFEMPLGLLKDGKLLKDFEIRMMTGQDRVLMANPKYRKNAGQLITALLYNCVLKIGGEEISKKDIMNLTTGDRDFILLMLRTISLPEGDVIHANMNCSSCNEPLYVEFPIDEIDIAKFSEKDFIIEDDKFIVHLKNKKYKVDVKMRLATGADQEKVSPLMDKNPIMANYRLYEECLVEWNGERDIFKMSFLQKQPTLILDWIEKEYKKYMPGPDWNQKIDCEICGAETTLNLANSDFLLPMEN